VTVALVFIKRTECRILKPSRFTNEQTRINDAMESASVSLPLGDGKSVAYPNLQGKMLGLWTKERMAKYKPHSTVHAGNMADQS